MMGLIGIGKSIEWASMPESSLGTRLSLLGSCRGTSQTGKFTWCLCLQNSPALALSPEILNRAPMVPFQPPESPT